MNNRDLPIIYSLLSQLLPRSIRTFNVCSSRFVEARGEMRFTSNVQIRKPDPAIILRLCRPPSDLVGPDEAA